MRRILKRIVIGVFISAIVGLIGYAIFPDQVKSIGKKVVKSTKQALIKVRDEKHKEKYKSFKPNESSVWGIDISHHQTGINWDELNKNKPYFVFLKSTEGTSHIDNKHRVYKNKLDELSIPSGSYHFFSYSTSGREQAKHFLNNTYLKKGDLHPVLDVEFKNHMPNKSNVINNVNEFVEYVNNELGVAPIIYCECDFYYKYLKDNLKSECIYWISDFWREPKCDYVLWQKTDKFRHSAFKGTIDYNVLNGTQDELENLKLK
mgnify:FL=1